MISRTHARLSFGVAIPVYRPRLDFLRRTVQSVTSQTRLPDSVVIREDGESWPEVADVFHEFKHNLPLFVTRNEVRVGMSANWNMAIRDLNTSLVMALSQDDELREDFVEVACRTFRAYPSLVQLGHGSRFIDGQSREIRHYRVRHRNQVFGREGFFILAEEALTYLSLRNGQALGEPSAVVMRREIFEAAGGYSDEFTHAADLELALRVAELGPSGYSAGPSLRRRIHAESLTRHNRRTGAIAEDRVAIIARHVSRLSLRDRASVLATQGLAALRDSLTLGSIAPLAAWFRIRRQYVRGRALIRLCYEFVVAVLEHLLRINRDRRVARFFRVGAPPHNFP